MSTMKRLRGLRMLVGDAVEHGSKAVEVVHKATAARTFVVLEAIPPLATPAKVVHIVHDASLTGIYGIIRAVSTVVGRTLDIAIDVAEQGDSNRAAETLPGDAAPLPSDPESSGIDRAEPPGSKSDLQGVPGIVVDSTSEA